MKTRNVVEVLGAVDGKLLIFMKNIIIISTLSLFTILVSGCGALVMNKGTALWAEGKYQEAGHQYRQELMECEDGKARSAELVNCSQQAFRLIRFLAHMGNYQAIIDECPGYIQEYDSYYTQSIENLKRKLNSNVNGKDRKKKIASILVQHRQSLLYPRLTFQRYLLEAYLKLNDPVNTRRVAEEIFSMLQQSPADRKIFDAFSFATLLEAYLFLQDSDRIAVVGKALKEMVTINESRNPAGELVDIEIDSRFFTSNLDLAAGHAIASLYYYEKKYPHAELLISCEIKKRRSNLNTITPLVFLMFGPVPGWSARNVDYETRVFRIDCILRQERYQEGLDEAVKLERELVKLLPEFKKADVSWTLDKLIGDALAGLGRRDEAIPYYKEAVDKMERQRSDIRGSRLRILYANAKDEIYDKLIGLLFSSGDKIGALNYSERARSRAFLDMLGNGKAIAKDDDSSQLLAQRDVLKRDLGEYARQLALANPTESESLIRNINDKMAEIDNVTAQLTSQYPDIASMVTVKPVAIQDIQAELDQRTKIVEYHVANDDLLVWVVGRNSFHAQGLPLTRTEFDGLVKDAEESLRHRNRAALKAAGSRLYAALFQPIVHRLDANDRINIVRHGKLHLIPFQILHANGRYLVEDHDFFYAPSANVFHLSKHKRVNKESSLLALGNPDLNNPDLSLPYAETEVNALKSKFKKATIFVGKDANQSNLLMNLGDHNIIHFATHGMFDRQFPMHSGLLLAGKTIADGLLTAEKIYAMDMKAYLVTLSACETAVGSVTQADEMVSLSRAFMYAGTPSVLSSLWSVDDEATSYLMQQFYGYLMQDHKVSAIRKAQLDTMKKYPDPMLWGAFTLIGDWM